MQLPTDSEVVCRIMHIFSYNTFYNYLFQVELLYRRALNDSDGLYTLAFADEIDYNVSEQSFRKLEKLLKEKMERGKLTVFLSI